MTYNTYMKKTTAVHTVDRSAARFGVPDPLEVCTLLAESIPADALRTAPAILDIGQGCCGISRSVVKRLVNEGYTDAYDAMFKVHGIDNNLALVKKAKRLGFINSVCADVEDLDPSKTYRVIIGNPPYQAPKTANGGKSPQPLWRKFLVKAAELVTEGGYVVLLVPSSVAKFHEEGKVSPALQKVPQLSVLSIRTGMETYFNVGTEISLVVFRKAPQTDTILLNGKPWNWKETSWVPRITDEKAVALLKKVFKTKSRFKFVPQYHGKPLTIDVDNSIGAWGMNRGKDYNLQSLEGYQDKERKAHLMCCEFTSATERDAALMLFQSPVYRFLKSMLMFGSDVAYVTLSSLPIPEGWQNLTSPDEVASLFGLTEEEVELLSQFGN
jgi:hypothetical protein